MSDSVNSKDSPSNGVPDFVAFLQVLEEWSVSVLLGFGGSLLRISAFFELNSEVNFKSCGDDRSND